MKNVKTLAKNLLSLTAAEMGSKGLAFITSLFLLANLLDAEGNGVYNWSQTLATFFIAFTVFGLDYTGVRDAARDKNKIPLIANTIISTRLLFAIISYIIIFFSLIALNVGHEKTIVALIFGITLFTNALAVDWVFRAIEKMEILAIRQLLVGVLNFIGVLFFIKSRNDIYTASCLYTGINVINMIWMLILYIKKFGAIKIITDYRIIKTTIKESYKTAIFHLISVFYNYSGVFFITILYKSDFETGVYSAAFKLFTFAMLASSIIQNVFYPQIAAANNNQNKREIIRKCASILFLSAGIVCFGIILFAGDVFTKFMRSSYNDSIVLIQLFMLVAFLAFYNVFLSQPLIAWKHERMSLRAILIGGTTNLLSSLVFIPFLGAKGAVLAFFLSELSVFMTLSYYFKRTLGLIFFKLFMKSISIGIVLSIGIIALQYYHINFIINMALFLILYLILGLRINSIKLSELKSKIFN